MRSKAKPPTKAERERITAAKTLGCVPCWLVGKSWIMCDYHHCLSGGKRRGHAYGYGNCQWHHVGIPWLTGKAKTERAILGPSLKLESKAYHERFGSEDELIAIQNTLLEKYKEMQE